MPKPPLFNQAARLLAYINRTYKFSTLPKGHGRYRIGCRLFNRGWVKPPILIPLYIADFENLLYMVENPGVRRRKRYRCLRFMNYESFSIKGAETPSTTQVVER